MWVGFLLCILTSPSRLDAVCGEGPGENDGEFTSGRVIILIHLQHEGLAAAASITVCLLRLLEDFNRDAQSAQLQPDPKAPWPD